MHSPASSVSKSGKDVFYFQMNIPNWATEVPVVAANRKKLLNDSIFDLRHDVFNKKQESLLATGDRFVPDSAGPVSRLTTSRSGM